VPPTASIAWDEYWRLTREAAAHRGGGPQEEVLGRFWTSFFEDALSQKPAPRVLDVACGNGAVARFALEASNRLHGSAPVVVGIDNSFAALVDLQTRFPSVLAVASDARLTPFADLSFDLVTSQFGIEYAGIEAPQEAVRLVATGGTLAAILHLKGGAIYRECAANLQATLAVQSSGIVSAARELFMAGPVSPIRRVTTLDQQRREARLAKAAKEVERVLRRHGDHVAGGVVRRLQHDIARMSARLGAYDPAELAQWIDGTARELRAYAGRMSSMLAAAIDDRTMEAAVKRITAGGLSVRIREKLHMGPAKPEPAAWVLVCDRR
jgi:SAM-dependent methyltransferase